MVLDYLQQSKMAEMRRHSWFCFLKIAEKSTRHSHLFIRQLVQMLAFNFALHDFLVKYGVDRQQLKRVTEEKLNCLNYRKNIILKTRIKIETLEIKTL